MVHKNCPICKIEFKVIPALKNVTITCGNKSCIKKWMSISRIGNNNNNYRGGKNKKCLVCGKSFYVGPVKSKTRKCCSRKCAGIIHSKAMSGEGNSRFGEGAKRVCKFCGKKYRSSPSLRLKFCSQKCYDNFKVGKNHPSWKGGKPQNYCIDCGNKIGYYSKRCNKCKFKKERAPNW